MAAGTIWHLQARFVYRKNGWTEKFYLQQGGGHGPPPDPRGTARDLLQRRVLWLGTGKAVTFTAGGDPLTWDKGPQIDLATISLTDNPKDGYEIDLNGFDSRPPNLGYDPINDRCSGPEFRFESGNARWGNRILRGAPDSWMTDMLPQPPMPVVPAGTVDPITGRLTPALPTIPYATALVGTENVFRLTGPPTAAVLRQLRASFLDAVVSYCGAIFRGAPVSTDSSTWTMPAGYAFVGAMFRQISTHRTGRRNDRTRARSKKRV